MLVGYLIQGNFFCEQCCRKFIQHFELLTPTPLKVFLENIGKYSQQCSMCRRVIVEGFKNLDGTPNNIFHITPRISGSYDLGDWVIAKFEIMTNIAVKDYEAAESLMNKALYRFLRAYSTNKLNSDDKQIAIEIVDVMGELYPILIRESEANIMTPK